MVAHGQSETDVSRSLPQMLQPISTLGHVDIEPIDVVSTSAAEDHQGYVWFSGGKLHRYDGYDYIEYKHDAIDTTSLSSNDTREIYVDRRGTLWVGAFPGLNRYDKSTDSFIRYFHDPEDPTSLSNDSVSVMLEDSQGRFWVGTRDGLNLMDRETGAFTHYKHNPDDVSSLSNSEIRALYEDSQGTLWVGTGHPYIRRPHVGEGGLNKYDPSTGGFTRYVHDPLDEKSLINNQIMSIYEDSRGTFYVGTIGDGLHSMDREAGTFTRHRYDPNEPTKLSRPFLNGTQMDDSCLSWACGGVSFIHEDMQGHLWIGGLRGGVNRYDLEAGTMDHFEGANSNLFDDTVWSLTETRDGTIWIGNWNGMHKVVSSPGAFQLITPEHKYLDSQYPFIVNSMLEDSRGMVWIGTQRHGVYRMDLTTGRYRHYYYNPSEIENRWQNTVYSLLEDREGTIWLGHGPNAGLSRYDQASDQLILVSSDLQESAVLGIMSMVEDSKGRFWAVMPRGGLGLFDRETGHAEIYKGEVDDLEGLLPDLIGPIYEDINGTLWLSSPEPGGLIRLVDSHPSKITFEGYLPNLQLTALHEDQEGRFWGGTRGGNGLHLIDRRTGTSKQYVPEQGISSIASLIEHEGYIWISSSIGIVCRNCRSGQILRFNPTDESFVHFDTRDGVPDMGFVINSALKTQSGTLLFGGMDGFVLLDPSSLLESTRTPAKLSLTDLHIFNDQILPGADAPIKRPIHLADQILITADKNNFMISYNAFSYRDASKNRYKYQLSGYDQDWVDARALRSARYAGVPPGTYDFRVRAVDSRGVESEEASIQVVVLPPWWQTWWAYTLFGVMFVSSVYGVDRVQRRRLIAKEREKNT